MNHRVHDPNRRQYYEFFPDSENLVAETRVESGGDGPPHFHPSQEERWTVRSGRVRFKVDGRRDIPEPGVEIVVPPGAKHSFKNVGDGEARIRAEVRPAGEIEAVLTEGADLARAGYFASRWAVSPAPRSTSG
jgi:quercetin dioxygenase-like cupin family protein